MDAVVEKSEIYTLTVPNYSTNLLTELNNLRTNNLCCDVRICTADEGFLYAHKIVMCSVSPYFKERVCLTSIKLEDVYLEDTTYGLMKCLLDFIYTGTLIIEYAMFESMIQLLNRVNIKNIQKLCENLVNKEKYEHSNVKLALEKIDSDKIEVGLEPSDVDKQMISKRQRKGKPLKLVKEVGIGGKNETEDLNVELGNSEFKGQRKGRLSMISKKVDIDDDKQVIEADQGNDELSSSRVGHSKENTRQKVVEVKYKRKSSRTKQKSILPSRKCKTKCLDLVNNKKYDTNNETKKSDFDDQNSFEDSNGTKEVAETDDSGLKADDMETEPLNTQGNNVVENVQEKVCHTKIRNKKAEVKTQCKVCNVTLSSRKEYTEHVKTCKKDTSKVCKLCGMSLPTHKEYLSHLKVHKDENGGKLKRIRTPWPCSVCSKILTSSVRKACHEYSKHGIPFESRFKLFSCPVEGCKYISASKHYIEIHTRGRHSNERPHVCEYCGKGFKLPSALATHINIHTKQKKFECEECQMMFHQKGGLDIHIKKHHMGEQSWSELCELCSEKFLHKAELCWHLYLAHGQPLPDRYTVFTCDLCDYKTIRKNKLERHMDAHEDRRPWTCNICGKKFVTKSYLNRHIKYHGEKKFVCDYEGCSYASVDKIGLRKHVRLIHTHKNLKPYNCSICSYKTALRGNLDKHIRSVHNLEVVTKHTVHMKVKFKDREAGDIITKEGQLVQSAKQRDKTNNRKSSFHSAEDFSLINAVERMSKKCENHDQSDHQERTDEQKLLPNSYTEDLHSPHDLTVDDAVATKQYRQQQQHQQQQQFIHPQNLEPSLSSQLHYPFPGAMNSRMTVASQNAGHHSEFYRSMEHLQMYKYQIANPYTDCE